MSVEEISIDLNRIEPPDEFEAVMARVKKRATVAGVIGGAIGLCIALVAWLVSGRVLGRSHVFLPIICGFGMSAMVTGIGLLYAPDSFFQSATGREYMKAIGTRNVKSAKIVICIALLVGCAVWILLGVGAVQLITKTS